MDSSLFDRVIVSTDDDEIAQISINAGAEVPFRRPENLSGDTVGNAEMLKHALNWMQQENALPEHFCCIYPSPFVEAYRVIQGYELLRTSTATTVYSMATFPYPIHCALVIGENGFLKMLWPENREKRSQELPEALHDAGQFYWFKTDSFL